MGCSNCSSATGGSPAGCNNNGHCTKGCGDILDVYDWLSNVYYEDDSHKHEYVEVKFKGTRKNYFKNVNRLTLEIGDKVVVEAQISGHDVGRVSLVGPLVATQMRKNNVKADSDKVKKLYRVATENDQEKYKDAKGKEYVTMMKSREYAIELGLQMKISDVEYQGDNTKATFYYTAEGRVDFRELIKVYARNFKVKIEMRQIGLRQEAGRLGGVGSCGRELCCSTWLTDFNSVPTTAARYQNLFLNPLKLSGQCGRLKCCLNYELDTYLEALEDFPKGDIKLKMQNGEARCVKTDVLKRIMFFIYPEDPTYKLHPMDVEDVKELLAKQRTGGVFTPEELDDITLDLEVEKPKEVEMVGVIIEDDVDRFEKKTKKKKRRRPDQNRNRKPGNRNDNQARSNQGQKERKQGQSEQGQKDRKPGKQQNQPKRQNQPKAQKQNEQKGENKGGQRNNKGRRNNKNNNKNTQNNEKK